MRLWQAYTKYHIVNLLATAKDEPPAVSPEKCENRLEPSGGNPRPQALSHSMPSTTKKVIVRKMDRDTINGYVAPSNFVHEGKLELLNTSGNVVAIELKEIKGVYFVREFGDSESRLARLSPAVPGLKDCGCA